MFGNILMRDTRDGFQRLVDETSPWQARKRRNIARQRHSNQREEAEKHQQQVYELIRQGSELPESERLPLALEAKSAQLNAIFARTRSFKNLKNQMIWRMVELGNQIQGFSVDEDDEVNVPIEEIEGIESISAEFEEWDAAITSELEQIVGLVDQFGTGGGNLEIAANDMLEQMANFDPETTAPEDVAPQTDINIRDSATGAAPSVGAESTRDDDVDVEGDIQSMLAQMGSMADQQNDASSDD